MGLLCWGACAVLDAWGQQLVEPCSGLHIHVTEAASAAKPAVQRHTCVPRFAPPGDDRRHRGRVRQSPRIAGSKHQQLGNWHRESRIAVHSARIASHPTPPSTTPSCPFPAAQCTPLTDHTVAYSTPPSADLALNPTPRHPSSTLPWHPYSCLSQTAQCTLLSARSAAYTTTHQPRPSAPTLLPTHATQRAVRL
jgi:hypothetical protein